MRIEMDRKLGFADVLIRPKRSTLKSRSEVDLTRSFTFLHSRREWSGLPLIAANMDTVGTFEMARALAPHGMITALHKHLSPGEWAAFLAAAGDAIGDRVMVTSGISEEDLLRLDAIMGAHPSLPFICLDVANGYCELFVETVKRVRERHPGKTIVAGNVVSGEMVEELTLAGADAVKVGIGSGSVCTTRVKTGVGYPQLSAVIECADAAHGLGGRIISDGGCATPGDVAKALGAGADFVMLGGMLAGHDECGGEILTREGERFKLYYGMSSATAMELHTGGVAEYRAAEGKTVEVPYRGAVEGTVRDLLGGLRSACTYVGASSLRELSKRTTFLLVEEQESRTRG